MGKGAKGAEGMRNDFLYRQTDEPHAERKKAILAKYGEEINKLQGSDWRPAPFVVAIVFFQLAVAYYQKDYLHSNIAFFLFAWVIGGALNHALSLMTHELSHNLLFKEGPKPWKNQYFGIFCNVAMGIPSSTTFKKYHLDHHRNQGDHDIDTDIPTFIEGKLFRNPFTKAIWLLLQPAFYALRPCLVSPKSMEFMDYVNALTIVATDLLIVKFCGLRGLLYLILSSLLGMGFHPVAGHFISEHYVFDPLPDKETQYETYSYYGPLNLICWNVGYHNEHHDFPNVPGWRLPQVRKIAPEFYDNLPQCHSWSYCLYRYVMDPNIGPFNRVLKDKKGSKKSN